MPFEKKVSVCRLHCADSCYSAQTNRPTLEPNAVPTVMFPISQTTSTVTATNVEVMQRQDELNIEINFPHIVQISLGLRYNMSPKSPHIRKSLSMTDGEKFKSPTFRVVTSNASELDNAQRTSMTERKRSWEASLVNQNRKREKIAIQIIFLEMCSVTHRFQLPQRTEKGPHHLT